MKLFKLVLYNDIDPLSCPCEKLGFSYWTETASVSFKECSLLVIVKFESVHVSHTMIMSLSAILLPDQVTDFCVLPSYTHSSLEVFWYGSHSVCILLLIISLNNYYGASAKY